MFPDVLIAEIESDLVHHGRSLVYDTHGKRLLVTTSELLNLPGKELILAYEGRGVFFFPGDRPLNHYRLLASGFPEAAARSIADMVNRLITGAAKRKLEATTVALEQTEND